MVVYAAAICSKAGKALLSRQYSDMSRVRIESLLSAFPKLVDPNSTRTFVETNDIRYVYHPLEKLNVVLITNKTSNIVEDLDTLRLIASIVKDICKTLDDQEVIEKGFDLFFAFDEVITMGYTDPSLTFGDVNTFLEMKSREEDFHNEQYEQRIKQALQQSKERERAIAKKKRENQGRLITGGISSSDVHGGFSTLDTNYSFSSTSKIGSFQRKEYTEEVRTKEKKKPKMMSFGKKKQIGGLVDDLVKSGEVLIESNNTTTNEEQVEKTEPIVQHEGILVKIEEKISATITRDGELKYCELYGEMFLSVGESSNGRVKVIIDEKDDNNYSFNAHTKLDKQLFAKQNVLALKDESKGFPKTGKPLKVLVWRSKNKIDESALPLKLTCWPSETQNGMTVSIEYEVQHENVVLENVEIYIPLPKRSEVTVESIEQGTYRHDDKNNVLIWILESIGKDQESGSLEFEVPTGNDESFFPIQISFTSHDLGTSRISIKDVVEVDDDKSCKYSVEYNLSADDYHLE